jgi:subtilisin family serine protease
MPAFFNKPSACQTNNFAGMLRLLVCVLVCCLLSGSAFMVQAQKPIQKGWHLLDRQDDGYFGISLAKAYELLKGRKAEPVIVAIIDGGIDTTHEDLLPVLWRNPHDHNANGKDDDNNGYPDDRYGWNFLGNRLGQNVEQESSEAARLYHLLKDKYENKAIEASQLSGPDLREYQLWQQVQKAIQVTEEDRYLLKILEATRRVMRQFDSVLTNQMGVTEYTTIELENFRPDNKEGRYAKTNLLRIFHLLEVEPEKTNLELLSELDEFIQSNEDLINLRDTPATNYRRLITNDDENNWTSRDYGNSDVMGANSQHGTHVAGIVAAVRNNGLGINGVADQVRIMSLRVVPKGDEHDKDVALAIRYAVDNGAKIINMSFGKPVSPQQQWVAAAIKYAAQKGVLLVHAAGNESEDLDSTANYPSAILEDGTRAPNMITVAASSDFSIKNSLIAEFTNYGRHTVDVFAPGVKIYSTVPTGNKYAFLEGTSMAAPVVSGIAALLLSYFPHLQPADLRSIIMQSVDKTNADKMYPKPGDEQRRQKISIAEACTAGGIVNAEQAVRLAIDWPAAKR